MEEQHNEVFVENELENLSDETKEQILDIARASGRDLSTVLERGRVKDNFTAFQEKDVSDPEAQLVEYVNNLYSEAISSSSAEFRGMIFGIGDYRNIRAGIINNKRQAYEDNPKQAKQRNHVNDNGEPTWSGNEDSMPDDAAIGDVIQPQYVRNYFGVAKKVDDGTVKFFDMTRWGDTEEEFRDDNEVPAMNTPVRFVASHNEDRSSEEHFALNHTNSTAFKELSADEVDDPSFFNEVELLKNYAPSERIQETDDVLSRLQDDEGIYGAQIFRGEIQDVSTNPNSESYKLMQIGNVNTARVVSIPDSVDTRKLVDNAKVFVIGRPWVSSNDDEADQLVITTYNIVVEDTPVDVEDLEDTDNLDEQMEEATEDDSESTSEKFMQDIEDSEEEEGEETESESEEDENKGVEKTKKVEAESDSSDGFFE